MNLTAPSQVRALLARHGIHPRRRLGQHFLIDANILRKVVEAAGLSPHDNVLEIGPGLGTLTRALAERARHVLAVELDQRLLPVLAETVGDRPNVRVVLGDALEVDLFSLCGGVSGDGWKVVANIPYNITGPLVARLLCFGEVSSPFKRVVLMVQEDVAQRLVALPGTRNYGAFTVLANYHATVEMVMRVPPSAFFPPPEVHSAVIRMDVHGSPRVEADPKVFLRVVKAAFGQRRKALRNTLRNAPITAPPDGKHGGRENREDVDSLLARAGIDGSRRGETLTLEEFAALARAAALC